MTADANSRKPPAVKPELIKDAEVVSSPSDGAVTVVKPITFGQQIFIWSMILLVGVIFGVGSSWTFLEQPQRIIENVAENDILVRKDVAERLQRALARSSERFALSSYEEYAITIRRARVAAAEGLQPAGADLDRVTEDFLAKTVPGEAGAPARTYRELLLEHRGAKDEVSRLELRRLLAERTGVEALGARNVGAAAVPTTVSVVLNQLLTTKLTMAEVELDAKHLLTEVKADDADVQSTYERLRSSQFTRRAQVTATVAAADIAALTAKQVIGDAEIATYYEQHKETYRKPPAIPQPPAVVDSQAPPEYQTLAEVTSAIKATLARTAAEQAAQAAIQSFNAVVDEKVLEQADGAAFTTAATAAGLAVTEGLMINEPSDGQVDLGTFGTIKDPAGLFSKDVGFITNPLQSAAVPGAPEAEAKARTWFVLRVTQRTPAGFRSLDEVRAEVQAVVAGNRAYQALLSEAGKLRAAAEAAGPGGLAKIFADPANAVWAAKVTEQPSVSPLSELHAPASEAGGAAGEALLAASLAMPSRPVALVEAAPAGGAQPVTTPRVRLMQFVAVKQDPIPPRAAADYAAMYRRALEGYQQAQFERTLREKLGK
jgi:hypothetical protein